MTEQHLESANKSSKARRGKASSDVTSQLDGSTCPRGDELSNFVKKIHTRQNTTSYIQDRSGWIISLWINWSGSPMFFSQSVQITLASPQAGQLSLIYRKSTVSNVHEGQK